MLEPALLRPVVALLLGYLGGLVLRKLARPLLPSLAVAAALLLVLARSGWVAVHPEALARLMVGFHAPVTLAVLATAACCAALARFKL